jgi:hypothetical protein
MFLHENYGLDIRSCSILLVRALWGVVPESQRGRLRLGNGWSCMLRVLAPAPREAWREVIASSPAALPEQTPEWVDAIVAGGGHEDASRLYESRDGQIAVLPLVRRRRAAGEWLTSFPPGWGIGGPVGPLIDERLVRGIVDDLSRLRATRITVRPDPLTDDAWARATAGTSALAVARCGHVLDLSGGIEHARARLSSSARRHLRIAQRRGVTVQTDTGGRLLPLYYQLFLRSVDRWARGQHEPLALARWRAGRRDPLAKLQAISAALSGRMRTTIAFVDGRPAAGVIVLHGRTAHYTRGAMDKDVAGPTHASAFAQWAAIEDACSAGIVTYHMGETGASASLAAYKQQFGATAVPYSEYRFERLPITRADSALRTSVKSILGFRDV